MIDWPRVNGELLENGFAVLPPFLSAGECGELRELYSRDALFRSTIDMKRYGFGRGTYRYFKYPLPATVQRVREEFYGHLVDSANAWSTRLRLPTVYPPQFSGFVREMRARAQTRPTPLILRYGPGDFNCLHQDINNELVFPYQVVVGLCESGVDYDGGLLILTQQRPRRQTVPHAIAVPRGGVVVFSSNFHPLRGARGYYRTVFKHGVSEVTRGDRVTLGIVFHDFSE